MRMQSTVKQVTVSSVSVLISLLFGGCQIPESASEGAAGQRQDVYTWTARDADDRWTFPVPDGWYGGSYYQIMDRVSAAERGGEGDTPYVQILRTFSRDARGLDAILFHLEMSADGSHGDASILKINTTPITSTGDGFPAINQITTELWTELGQDLFRSTAGALDVKLIRHQEDVVKGNRVATAGFKVIMGAGRDDRYDGEILIYRPPVVTSFSLEAPWHVAGLRLEEMWTMVRSIEFKE